MSYSTSDLLGLVTVAFMLQVAFDLKHFFADYPLQTPWMLGKFAKKGWVVPLAAHSGVHFLGTVLVLGSARYFISIPWRIILLLAICDFVIHFVVDRIKASPDLLGRYEYLTKGEMKDILSRKPDFTIEDKKRLRSNWMFWQMLGLDQLMHHLTHDFIWFAAVLSSVLFS